MCGSDPESFYPRAYDLYDPLECGPLVTVSDAPMLALVGNGAYFTLWLHMFDIVSPRRADFALNFKFTKAWSSVH